MAVLKLSAPWQIYYKELCLLFEQDEEIRIIYDTDQQVISIYVDNPAKANAMAAALPTEKGFGDVTLTIVVIPANNSNLKRAIIQGSKYENLFYKNPIVNEIVIVDGIMTNPITYVIFKKEVVQYFNDDLGDAHGVCSTLYQDIAKRVLEPEDSIHFCTDTKASSSYAYTGCTLTTSDMRVGF